MHAQQRPYFDDPPLALAHRGGSSYAPNTGLENTLAAFQAAVDLGYRYVETDVHASADGVLFAFHDDHLDRVTDAHGAIADLPASAVRAARLPGGHGVPTLDEALTALPRTRFNIDIKSRGAVRPLWEAIQRHAAHDRVCVGSFSNRRLWAFRRLARGRVATAAGPLGTAALRLLPGPLWRLAHTPGEVFQVPVEYDIAGRTVHVVTARFVRRAHALGRQVHVWTIDDPDEMRRLLALGVDGLVTDRIDTLLEVLGRADHT